MSGKRIIIIAGPNGAGKSTFARWYLPGAAQCPRFINADTIAAGLSRTNSEATAFKAGRIMLEQIDECVGQGESFAIETTLSGLTYVGRIREWRSLGYHVSLIFLSVPCADIAVERVAQRVRHGGHFITEAVVRRRFEAGLQNFEVHYKRVVNTWIRYDNFTPELLLLEKGSNL